MRSPTTSRVNLTRIVFDKENASGMVDPAKIFQGSHVRQAIGSASRHMVRYSIPLEEGPYSDHRGALGKFCDYIHRLSGSRLSFVKAVAEAISGRGTFVLNDSLVFAELPVTAGTIFAGESRERKDSWVITHKMEPYIVATSLLRREGFESYPALAITGDEEFQPVIVIYGIDDIQFSVLSLSKVPPPMHTLEILSDTAVLGLTHAIEAENIARLLARKTISMMQLEGDYPSEEEVGQYISLMGNSLFECRILWPGSPFIAQAIDLIKSRMTDTYAILAADFLRSRRSAIPEDHLSDHIMLASENAMYLGSGLATMVHEHMERKAEDYLSSEND